MAQTSKVAGVVQIDGTPAAREVRAFGYYTNTHDIDGTTVSQSKSLGQSTSDPDTGAYTIDLLAGYGQEVFVVAFDDYGDRFISNQSLAVGDRIHPSTPSGHVFECTGEGILPQEEPTWIVDTEANQLYGTAAMIARVLYRPMVHGPIVPDSDGVAAPWTPADLFMGDFGGVWYDFSDLTTMYEDSSGLTQVTGDGQAVGFVLDKSGKNNNGFQSVDLARPLYAKDGDLNYLEFDQEYDEIGLSFIPGDADNFIFSIAVRPKTAIDPNPRYFAMKGLGVDIQCGYINDGTVFTRVNGTTYNTQFKLTIGISYVIHHIRRDGVSSIRINGINRNFSFGTIPSADTDIGQNNAVLGSGYRLYGQEPGDASTDFKMAGSIHSALFLYGQIANEELEKLDNYLATLSGITL